ncbi:MAG TPA: hypothetical protein VML01_06200 [Bryobacterales bacterium]|nr:hypothetical protein [Bryobacterales bacterium]
MLTEETLTKMLRSLGVERQRLDREIQRLEHIADEAADTSPRRPPRSEELSNGAMPDSKADKQALGRAADSSGAS